MFKYGISKQKESTINIELVAEAQTITFCCENRIFNNQPKTPERKGVGIANTKQRLEYIYPKKHLLSIAEKNNMFKVKLTLRS